MSTALAYSGGWIPYEARDAAGQRMTDEFHEQIGSFGNVAESTNPDVPELCSIDFLHYELHGTVLPRINQVTGSCVGASGGNVDIQAAFADRYFRGDNDQVKLPFFLGSYGVSRKLANMRGKGSGSYGAALAKAKSAEHFGHLPIDHPKVPQPTVDGIWVKYDRRTELDWSYSPQWPVPYDELHADADDFAHKSITRINSAEEAVIAHAQGYPQTLASMFGTRPRVEKGVLLGRWNLSWSHQMGSDGFYYHPELGLLFKINNQWHNVHGLCPLMKQYGIEGSFWMLASDYDKICKRGEVYAYGEGGYPGRTYKVNLDFLKG